MELEIGEFKKINSNCYISKVEYTQLDGWYVVSLNLDPEFSLDDNYKELGHAISRGKTWEIALVQALDFLTKKFVDMNNEIENFQSEFNNLLEEKITQFIPNGQDMILPLIDDSGYLTKDENGKTIKDPYNTSSAVENAGVIFDKKDNHVRLCLS